MKIILRILLFPFSILYGTILFVRNKFFDWNIINSRKFNFPVISVGNLNVGGVGKTPHIEYLIKLLQQDFMIATLSRGYKRKTKGFVLANNKSTIEDIGDEPLQYKTKFKNLIVAVDEKRVNGILEIKKNQPPTEVILLDDAYQHRYVKPSLNILVTDFNNLYINDFVLPSGRLRELPLGSNRANIIIVSKSPENLSFEKQSEIEQTLKPLSSQKVYFSYVDYGKITPFTKKNEQININNSEISILLFTGIANPLPLYKHLSSIYKNVNHLKFNDHHSFDQNDIKTIKKEFNNIDENNKIIITTEKDIMRLSLPKILDKIQDIPLFYIPIEIKFHGSNKEDFDAQIIEHVRKNKGN